MPRFELKTIVTSTREQSFELEAATLAEAKAKAERSIREACRGVLSVKKIDFYRVTDVTEIALEERRWWPGKDEGKPMFGPEGEQEMPPRIQMREG